MLRFFSFSHSTFAVPSIFLSSLVELDDGDVFHLDFDWWIEWYSRFTVFQLPDCAAQTDFQNSTPTPYTRLQGPMRVVSVWWCWFAYFISLCCFMGNFAVASEFFQLFFPLAPTLFLLLIGEVNYLGTSRKKRIPEKNVQRSKWTQNI